MTDDLETGSPRPAARGTRSRTGNYLRALASGYVVAAATVVVGLWLTPFTLRYLDRERFAVFTLAGDVMAWLTLLDLGFVSVLNSRAAQITGRPDRLELDTLASTTFFVQLATAAAVLIAGTALVWWFPWFFPLSAGVRQEATNVVALMVLSSAVTVVSQTFSTLLFAHQQAHVDNLLRLGLVAIRAALTVALLMAGVGLVSLAWANLAATAAMAATAVFRVRKYLPALSISLRHFRWAVLKGSGRIGTWFSLGGIAGVLIVNLDRIVTAKLVSVETVTTLALTGKVYVLAWTFIQLATGMARPALAQLVGSGRLDRARQTYEELAALSGGIAITLAACLWAGNGHFVRWWVGPQNYGGAALDALLALNVIVHAWVLPNRAMLAASLASVPEHNLSRFAEGALNVALSVTLGQAWGVKGVVAATAIAGVASSCWYLPRLTARFFGVGWLQLHRSHAARLALLALAAASAAVIGRVVAVDLRDLPGAAVGSAVALAVCAPALWFVALNKTTRSRALAVVRGAQG